MPRYLKATLFIGFVVAALIAALYGHFFSPFAGAFAIVASYGAGLLYSRTEGGQRKALLRAIFANHVSSKTFRALVNAPAIPALDGDQHEASVLVCEAFN